MKSAYERMFAVMTRPLPALLYSSLVVLSFFYLDKPIARYFYELDLKENLPIITYVTNIALGGIYLILFFCMGIFFRCIYVNRLWEERSWFLFICVAVPSIICTFLKVLLGRARPDLFIIYDLYGFYGPHLHAPYLSCPSGHTTVIMAVMFALNIIFLRFGYTLILTGLMIAFLRVVLLRHYLSDILVGFYLSLVMVGVTFYFCRYNNWLVLAWQRPQPQNN